MNICKGYSKIWFLALLLVTFVAGCADNAQEIPNIADTSLPTATSTSPINAATGVPIGNKLTVTFSGAMDPSTITTTTFTVKQGTTAVPGTVAYSGVTAVFTPTSNLAVSTLYTATITTGAKSLGGKALASDFVWNFTTGASADATKPTVSSTVPLDLAAVVAINSPVTATFSEPMDPTTFTTTTFTLKQGTTAVSGAVTYTGVTAVFTPASNLAVSTPYTATITTGVKDLGGNTLAVNKVWNFTTGAAADIIKPTVLSTVPATAATGVATGSTVSATFSEAMAPLTITTTTFTLMQGATVVPGAVAYTGVTAVFTPTSNLLSSTNYTATITTGAKDLAGNTLAVNKVWSFTTGTTVALGPLAVNLGTAGNFVILAKSAISTTVGTAVTGNIGLSPAAASFITGFTLSAPPTTFSTSPIVTGQVFASDYNPPTPINLTTAVLDMQTAYTDAAGRAPDFTELGAGNIGGLTLVPGTYKWGTGVLIPTDVTLSGGPNDVWIFQIAQNLVMSSATNIKLLGGAQAKNIFWQVFGIVDVGTTAHFEGIALVQTAITLKTGASANGRLLAQTAVNLDQNAVIQPAP